MFNGGGGGFLVVQFFFEIEQKLADFLQILMSVFILVCPAVNKNIFFYFDLLISSDKFSDKHLILKLIVELSHIKLVINHMTLTVNVQRRHFVLTKHDGSCSPRTFYGP